MRRSILGIALLLVGSTAAQAQATKWDSLARSLFKELVEINTVTSTGDTLKAAQETCGSDASTPRMYGVGAGQ